MEGMSLTDVRKTWIKYVASTGSITHSQRHEDFTQKICQALATAFAPSDDSTTHTVGEESTSAQAVRIQPPTHKRQDGRIDPDSQQTNVVLATQPHQSTHIAPTTDDQPVLKQSSEEQDNEMTGAELQGNKSTATAKTTVGTDIVDEQPASVKDQSVSETDEAAVAKPDPADHNKELSGPDVVADVSDQTITPENMPLPAPADEVVPPSFDSMPLKPAYTELRALYLELIYHDRFILLSNPTFVMFLSEQPRLSQLFLRYLITHRFGIRYVHRDGGNANHGITPFRYPFLPVRRRLPLSAYWENRWPLLNDQAWLAWVSTEQYIMAAFWAEISFRGGLGVMQRVKRPAERELNSAGLLF